MLLFETIDRMHRIHHLIKREATGTADEFAERFRIKKRQLYYLLDEFKDYGAVIRYSRIRNTYYYDNDFEVKVHISTHPLSEDEKTSFNGGSYDAIIPLLLDSNFTPFI